MNETLAAEYQRIRRKTPWLSAKQAMLWAKGNQRPLELDWHTFDGRHVATATGERDGYDVKVIVDYDEYASIDIEFTDDPTSGIKNPRFQYGGNEAWYGRREVGTDKRYVNLESGYTLRQLADDYHKRGDAKNVAWENARESLQDEAEGYLGDDYIQVVVRVKVGIDGITLGEASIGSDFILDYGTIERELDSCVIESALIEEAIDDAKANLASRIEAERERLARMEALTT